MNANHLYQNSRGYTYLRKFVTFIHGLYYREICVIHAENIPDADPVIFAPNHQNALMDALSIICTVKKQPVFMARADIFRKETVRKILTFLKIIPVYRMRDGMDNLANNDESFEIAMKVLKHRQSVGIMPEGNHGDQHRLRPLKKGFARFALKAQEQFGTSMHLKIIPVGLEYSSYNIFRSKLLVIYGDPIDVSDYMEEYAINQQRTLLMLRDRLSGELKRIMLNIDLDDHYPLIMNAKMLYAPVLQRRMEFDDSYYGRFQAEKDLTDKLTRLASENAPALHPLNHTLNEYYSSLQHLKLTNEVIETPPRSEKAFYTDLLRNLFFLPVAVFGVAFHFIPFWISKHYSEKIKDTQFRSSVKFVLILIIFPIYYLLFMALPFPLITRLLILFIMPVLGILSFDYITSLPKLRDQWRYLKLLKAKSIELTRLLQVRNKAIQLLDQLI